MRHVTSMAAGIALGVCLAGAAQAQQEPMQQAKISQDSARAIALQRVPNATVKSEELEKEHGKLIYSFDLTVAGKTGVEEVNVDAMTGEVVSVEHESAKKEQAEAKKEKAESTKVHVPR